MANCPPRGKILWYGGASIKHRDGVHEGKRVLVAEFEDTAALQEAVNSGFANLDMGDDSVAVVLDGAKPSRGEP